MGKIVKFCNACDEGFAEKFAFCPNCGAGLQAFEMNPVAAEPVVKPEPEIPVSIAAVVSETPAEPMIEPIAAASVDEPFELRIEEPVETIAEEVAAAEPEPVATEEPPVVETAPVEVAESIIEESEPEESEPEEIETVTSYKIPAPAAPVYAASTTYNIDGGKVSLDEEHSRATREGDFYITVIEEKNVGTRNKLLLGTFGLMLVTIFSGLVYNIFSKDLDIGSINDDIFNAVLVEDVPAVIEEEAPQPKAPKKDAGGGGGGGREEKEETTRGDLADQTKTPIRPPDAKVPRLDNPALKLPPPSTEGDRKFEKKYDRWGDPNGRFESFSNGTGSGGGQGSGQGTGQGSGRGTGAGSGTGSGSGGGLGSGNGDGRGRGNQGDIGDPPPPRPVGVTQGLKIVSKPQPRYTDAARQNNIQGKVLLSVTFLASGAIGDVSAVRGLPNGLTEQAIAAARNIRFEPAKVDGVGRTVKRQIEYTFTIY